MAVVGGRRAADRIRVVELGKDVAAEHARPHADRRAVLGFVIAGAGWHWQGREAWRAEPGSLFFVAPGEPHDASGLDAVRGWMVEFAPELVGLRAEVGPPLRPTVVAGPWLAFLRPACLPQRLDVPPSEWERWVRRFERLAEELRERREGYAEVAAAHLTVLLVDLARLGLPELSGANLRLEPVAARVLEEIERRYREPLTVAELAEALAVSPDHLSRLVRKATGASISQWLTERRMAEARRLLLVADDPIAVVAERVGYRDAGYFGRVFRKLHGVSPRGWRARTRVQA